MRRFTVIELLIVCVILAILISLLLPKLNRAKHKAKEISCFNNLKQLALVSSTYRNDNKNSFPFTVERDPVVSGYHWVGTKGILTSYWTVSKRPLNVYLGNFNSETEDISAALCPLDKIP